MRTHIFLTAIIAWTLIFTSCTEDLIIEPDMNTENTVQTFEEEYLLAIRAETELSSTDFCDSPQCGHMIPLSGDGLAFSNTFGPMDVNVNLDYDTDNGRVSGTMTFTVRNTEEKLHISIEEKGTSREWHELNGSCRAASSYKPFAEMNFNGEMCFEQLPGDMRSMGKGHTAVILITGELK
jgi:hypothetical protein